MPSDYARLTADVHRGAGKAGKMSAAKKLSASTLHLAAYMKLPRLLLIGVFISSYLRIYL